MRRHVLTLLGFILPLIVNAQSSSTFNIIYKHDFENNTRGLYDYNQWKSDWNNPAYVNGLDKTYIIDGGNGNQAMQWNYPQGSVGPTAGGGQFEPPNNAQADEIYMSYNIQFKPGFEWVLGGKLPGLKGGPQSYYSGVQKPGWSDGFSNGLMWGHGYAGQDDKGGIYFYTYYQDQSGLYGDSYRWGNFKFQTDPGRWYNITIRMVMNTIKSDGSGGNYDGIMEGFVDGKLVVSKTGMRFRNTSSVHIDKMKIYSHFGGSGSEYGAARDEWTLIDDVYLFTYGTGVSVPRGNTPSSPGRVLQLPNLRGASMGTVPASPTGLSVSSKSGTSVSLKWSDNAQDETGYRIERSGDGSTYVLAANLGAGATTYTDGGLNSGTTYDYRVRAYNSYGNSSWSNVVAVTTDQATTSSGTGPMACWTLNNSGVDQTGDNYNLTLHNGITYTTDKAEGTYSLLLDGSDDYASSPAINLGDAFTLALWVKIPSGQSNIQTLLANGPSGSGSNGFKFLVNTYATTDRKMIFESGDGTNSSVTTSDANVFEFDKWNYVAVTVNRSTGSVRLYDNGVDVTSLAGSHKSFKNNDMVWLGRMTNSLFGMKGEIDHADVYGRILSASEIAAAMSSSLPVTVKAPSGLTPSSANGRATLSWTDNSNNETGFVVERSLTATSGFAPVITLPANQTAYSDVQVTVGTTYYYRVKALCDKVESSYSNTVSIVIGPMVPAAPSNLAISKVTANSLNLTWTDNASNEDGFHLERSLSPATGFTQIASPAAGTISYDESGLTANTTYYYRVQAYNASGSSAWSAIVPATTATAAVPSAPDGAFAYWPLDNTGTDLSGHGYNLTLYNGARYTTDHAIGSASMWLDGSNDCAASPAMDPGNTFTMTVWVKIPSGRSNIQTVLANGPSGSSGKGFKLMINTYGTTDRSHPL